ncbi:MAG: hypothetical protein AAB477_03335 [Patescibacteria group bacterium]
MAITVCPKLLAWFIGKAEESKEESWWPEFLITLLEKPESLIQMTLDSLPEKAAKAFTELNVYVEVEFTFEFAQSIVIGVKEHFIKKEPALA